MQDIRKIGRWLLVAGSRLTVVAGARAETPVRIVVSFRGIVDTVARQLQPRLHLALGQMVLIDNCGGAGGTVEVGEVARANPDGCTLVNMMFLSAVLDQPHVRASKSRAPAQTDARRVAARVCEQASCAPRHKPVPGGLLSSPTLPGSPNRDTRAST